MSLPLIPDDFLRTLHVVVQNAHPRRRADVISESARHEHSAGRRNAAREIDGIEIRHSLGIVRSPAPDTAVTRTRTEITAPRNLRHGESDTGNKRGRP